MFEQEGVMDAQWHSQKFLTKTDTDQLQKKLTTTTTKNTQTAVAAATTTTTNSVMYRWWQNPHILIIHTFTGKNIKMITMFSITALFQQCSS